MNRQCCIMSGLTGLCLALSVQVTGQASNNQDFEGLIPIGLAETSMSNTMKMEVGPLVASTISTAITQEGLSQLNSSDIFIASNLDIIEERVTGTYPIVHQVEVQLSLAVCDHHSKVVFSSTAVRLEGIGRSEGDAVREAIRSLGYENPAFVKFAAEARGRVLEYFGEQCNRILAQARVENEQDPYELVSLLQVIPLASSCHDEAVQMRDELVLQFVEEQCAQAVIQARNRWNSTKSAEEALQPLSAVVFTDDCYAEYASLVEDIETELARLKAEAQAEAQRERDYIDRLRQEEREAEAERRRWEREDRRRAEAREDQRLRDARGYRLELAEIEAEVLKAEARNRPKPAPVSYYNISMRYPWIY